MNFIAKFILMPIAITDNLVVFLVQIVKVIFQIGEPYHPFAFGICELDIDTPFAYT